VIKQLGVVIPAANEEAVLDDCLRAILASRRQLIASLQHSVIVRVVVVLDGCVDNSADVVARYASVEAVHLTGVGVGAARHAGAMRVLAGGTPAAETWLANTDADSVVSPQWLGAMLDEAAHGAHVVLGTVRPDGGLSHAGNAAWHGRHILTDGHPHVHGANFGIRGDVYLALDGWPPVLSGEDTELAARASSAGHLRVVRSGRVPVTTSTRQVGRAPHGFSSYLRGLSA
jgi:glycosyltransferase involved in cell wall biosynthesis